MSNYDKTMLSVLAYCEIKLTDLEILSELKTGTQQYERYQLASYVYLLCTIYTVLYVDTGCIQCMRVRGYMRILSVTKTIPK